MKLSTEKKTICIRIDEDIISYFKDMSNQTDIPYQRLINLYLRDCVETNRNLNIHWNKC